MPSDFRSRIDLSFKDYDLPALSVFTRLVSEVYQPAPCLLVIRVFLFLPPEGLLLPLLLLLPLVVLALERLASPLWTS